LVVGEAQHSDASGAEPQVAHGVAGSAKAMHRTVDFDDERCLAAEEIDHEGTQWMLSAKLVAELAVS
jgi:hypothetical protein